MKNTTHNPANQDISIVEAITAARIGNIKSLQSWLEAGNDPNRYDNAGWTPLLWASARGNSTAVNLLLNDQKHPADISMGHRESNALPVHLAGHSGNIETAKTILEHKPEHLNAVWELNGHTILLQGTRWG